MIKSTYFNFFFFYIEYFILLNTIQSHFFLPNKEFFFVFPYMKDNIFKLYFIYKYHNILSSVSEWFFVEIIDNSILLTF